MENVDFDMVAKEFVVEVKPGLQQMFVASGETIGDGCIVWARSTVFHDLPKDMICMDLPAKPVCPR